MQAFFEKLRATISAPRLEVYRSEGDTDFEVIAKYLWNISLCEALYPALHTLEVALRNTIHDAATGQFKRHDWFEPPHSPLRGKELAAVERAKAELSNLREPHEIDRIVAQLTFGFWVSLLNARYDVSMWRRMLLPAFPGMPHTIRTRKRLSTRLNDIRKLRNRVFHHQRINHWPNLPKLHADTLEAIGWINPQFLKVLILADRFHSVHTAGLESIRGKLSDIAGVSGTEFNG